MTSSFKTEFIASGCALRPNVLDWGAGTGSLLFAANGDVCIASVDIGMRIYRISQTFHAHADQINSIKVGTGNIVAPGLDLFCTASSGGEFAVWRIQRENSEKLERTTNPYTAEKELKVTQIVRGKRDSAIVLAKLSTFTGLYAGTGNTNFLLCTAAFNRVILTSFEETAEGKEEEREALARSSEQALQFPGRAIVALDLVTQFDQERPFSLLLLAVGLTNGTVELFTSLATAEKERRPHFVKAISLQTQQNIWVRSLAFKVKPDGGGFLLASAADDIIKLWAIEGRKEEKEAGDELRLVPNIFSAKFGGEEDQANGMSMCLSVCLESVMHAPERRVLSLNWHPSRWDEFLTAGADSVTQWRRQQQHGAVPGESSPTSAASSTLWLPSGRIGDGQHGEEECYDASYSPDGRTLVYHSLSGAFHVWHVQEEDQLVPASHTLGGHIGPVADLAWNPSGTYLLSCGQDKSTRLFARLADHGSSPFFELARPQLHGHPLHCVASLSDTTFVSGAEEKIFRVFQANALFAANFAKLTGVEFNSRGEHLPTTMAFQSELSLTNVPAEKGQQGNDALPPPFTKPPREEQLARTLFPEQQKLYGHGYETVALASNHAGTVVATSCRASHAEHAAILLWDSAQWQERRALAAHQLTVTQLAFSRDDRFLLSASRDRTWALFRLKNNVDATAYDYTLWHQPSQKSSRHSRIIWCCAWSPVDFRLFATGSRDKTLNIWRLKGEEGKEEEHTKEESVQHQLSFTAQESVTAVDFGPAAKLLDGHLLALGLESGKILLLLLLLPPMTNPAESGTRECHILREFSRNFAHSGTITRIRFRPQKDEEEDGKRRMEGEGANYELASSSANGILKIHKLQISILP